MFVWPRNSIMEKKSCKNWHWGFVASVEYNFKPTTVAASELPCRNYNFVLNTFVCFFFFVCTQKYSDSFFPISIFMLMLQTVDNNFMVPPVMWLNQFVCFYPFYKLFTNCLLCANCFRHFVLYVEVWNVTYTQAVRYVLMKVYVTYYFDLY